MIDGVTYQIDLSQPSKSDPKGNLVDADASRIVNLMFEGAPVDPAQKFVIATNNYRASGGGSFPGAKGDTIIFEGQDTNRDVIVRYIVDQGKISPSADSNWHFAPIEGTSVLFETGPKAQDYADSVEDVTLTPAGQSDSGFLRFKLDL